MAYEISLTKRTNGGYTVVADGETWYPSELKYHGTDGGVILYDGRLNLQRYYLPDEWTIQTVSGYTTVVDVCDALDALGVLASDTLEDMEALLTTIDADTSAIKVAVELMDDDLDDARIALQVIDDWDESDRAKVNPIVGQAGIAAGAGAVGATVPRVTLASDDPAVAALQTIDNAVDGNYLNVNQNIAGTDVAAGSGVVTAQTQRVTLATDDVNAAAIKTAVELVDDAIYTDGTGTPSKGILIMGSDGTNPQALKVNADGELAVNLETADIEIGAVEIKNSTDDTRATVGANGLYVDVQASALPSGAATETTIAAVKTAVEVMDDWDDGNYCNVNMNVAGTDVAAGTGTQNAQTLRVVLATDQAQLTNALKVTGATSAPAVLVAAGSAANVTGAWADFGAEITTGSAHTLALWLAVTHTDSVNVRVRILGKHTASTGAEFLIPIKTISSTDVKVNGHYYELDSDATQNILLDWDVSAVPYAQVQVMAETVGSVADTVSGDYTLMV